MEEKNRQFNGVWIPKEIYLDSNLNWLQKILLVEINSYTENGKACFFSNAYLSKFLGISERQVSENIKKLKTLGYIEETAFDGRKRYLKSCLKYCNPDKKKTSSEPRGKLQGRQEENFYHTKIDTNLNTKIDYKEEERINAPRFKKPLISEIQAYFFEKTNDSKFSIEQSNIFFEHYEENGWKRGTNPMRDWKKTVNTWLLKEKRFKNNSNKKNKTFEEKKDNDFLKNIERV